MKSQPNDAVTQNSAARPLGGTGYAPSVPISVYRELAAELQATKTLLDSMNTQNQQLARHNQHLRQEINQIAQSAVNLQQTADSFQPSWNLPHQHPEMAEPLRAPRPARSPGAKLSDEYVIEQAEPRSRMRSPAPQREVGGLWLMLVIVAIVITAFGAGFLVVRPLLNQNR